MPAAVAAIAAIFADDTRRCHAAACHAQQPLAYAAICTRIYSLRVASYDAKCACLFQQRYAAPRQRV